MRIRNIAIFAAAVFAGALGGSIIGPRPAEAVAREIIDMQRDITTLLQGQRDMTTQMTTDHTVIKTLVQQAGDNVNKLNSAMGSVQKSVQDVQANSGARLDTMSTQVQGLSDNLEEIKSRLGKLNQQLVDLQSSVQSIDAKISGTAPGALQHFFRNGRSADWDGRAHYFVRRRRFARALRRHALFQRSARHHQRQVRSRSPGISGLPQVLQRHRPRLQRAILSRRNRLFPKAISGRRLGIRQGPHRLSQELQARPGPPQERHGSHRARPESFRRPRSARSRPPLSRHRRRAPRPRQAQGNRHRYRCRELIHGHLVPLTAAQSFAQPASAFLTRRQLPVPPPASTSPQSTTDQSSCSRPANKLHLLHPIPQSRSPHIRSPQTPPSPPPNPHLRLPNSPRHIHLVSA